MQHKSYKTMPELRQPENLIPAYRGVQILQQRVNQMVGVFLIPAEAISTKLIIYSAYMIIKYRNIDNDSVATVILIMYVVSGLGFWSGILFMGEFFQFCGIKVVNSWKYHVWPNKEQKKHMGKFRRSCKPMQFNFGKTYVIKRGFRTPDMLSPNNRVVLIALRMSSHTVSTFSVFHYYATCLTGHVLLLQALINCEIETQWNNCSSDHGSSLSDDSHQLLQL